MLLYKITPVELNKIYIKYTCYGKTSLNNIKEFTIKDYYSSGYGFRIDPVTEQELNNNIKCDPLLGWGNNLKNNTHCDFYFDESFDEVEKNTIKACYNNDKEKWLNNNPFWYIENDTIFIKGKIKIDLVNDYNKMVIISDIQEKIYEH